MLLCYTIFKGSIGIQKKLNGGKVHMFINNVTGDANNTEGFGSIYSFKLISYALSEIYKIGFVNNEMRNIVGGGYVDMSQEEYDKTVNDYFDLDYKNVKQVKENPFDIIFNYSNKPELIGTEKIISRLKRDFILNSFNRNINKIMSKEILSKLGKGIPESSNSKYFKEGLNIVIHLRAPLKDIDIKFEPERSYFYGSYKDIDLLNNFIRQIEHSEKNQKLNFHILTIGENDSLKRISSLDNENDVIIHNDLNVFESFSMMIHNDALIGGFSNLSYIAHLLSNKRTIFPQNCSFGSKPFYPNIIRLDNNGMLEKLNSDRLITQMVNS